MIEMVQYINNYANKHSQDQRPEKHLDMFLKPQFDHFFTQCEQLYGALVYQIWLKNNEY